MLQARQWGTGVSGGAEAVAIVHLLIKDMWSKNVFTKPIAIVQVDQKDCVLYLQNLSTLLRSHHSATFNLMLFLGMVFGLKYFKLNSHNLNYISNGFDIDLGGHC